MAQIQKGTTYSTGDQVTATNLNALADAAILLPGAITDQTAKTVPLAADTVLIHSAADTALRKSTLTQLFSNATGIPLTTGVTGILPAANGGTGVNNGANTITIAGNVTHAGAFTQSFTATANTSLTLPVTGTLATLAGSEALSNKTITASPISGSTGAFTTLSASSTSTLAAINSSGVVTLSSANGNPLRLTGTTTDANAMIVTNTGGTGVFGMENSTGGNQIIGSTAYDLIVRGPSGIAFSANAGSNMQMRLSSTGLAVTGALSVTSTAYPAATIKSSYAASSKTYSSLLLNTAANNQGSFLGFVYDSGTPANSYTHITPYGLTEGSSFVVGTSGNVGIGTTSPGDLLTLGAVSGTTGAMSLWSSSAGDAEGGKLIFRSNVGGGNTGILAQISPTQDSSGGNRLDFKVGAWNNANNAGSALLTIKSSGNVGIGTTSTAYGKLSVSGAEATTNGTGAAIGITNSASGGSSWTLRVGATGNSTPAGGFSIADVNDYRLTITSAGNVGIGTTSPSDRLTVVGASGGIGYALVGRSSDGYARFQAYDRSGTVTTGSLAFFEDGSISFNRGNTGSLVERARIDSSGNFMVATNGNPYFASAGIRLNVVEGIQIAANSGTTLDLYANGITTFTKFWYNSSTGGSASGGSQVGSITYNGTLVLYNQTSDYRLKDITGPLTDSGTFIDALKPKVGTWKSNGSKFAGFVAHEFAEVSPSSVTGEKDAVDADGKPVYQAMQASSAEVIANLVAELQSLRQRMAAVEGK